MIALFPGRFNPPHIGHILSLLSIKDEYDKIIVGVTDFDFDGKKPSWISVDERISILTQILKHFPNKFEIIRYKEPFRRRTDFSDLPKFDIIVTGSEGVYNNVIKHGLKARLIERSPVYRGEYIREAYLKGSAKESKKCKR